LRAAFEARDLRPTKALGQNFVVDPNTIRKVVDVAGVKKSDRVLEIGAGAGSLTLGLAAAAKHVTALEFDRRLLPVLDEMLAGVTNVDVIAADALEIDLSAINARILVANLPYNIAVPVVVRVLEQAPDIQTLVVMTQREVGERLVAGPGSKTYGQVSVIARYFADASLAAKVSRQAFWPVPNVDSVLVRLERVPPPPDTDRSLLFRIIKAGFAQRRKTLRNALGAAGFVGLDGAMAAASVAPTARAEDLELAHFVLIAQNLEGGTA
jgi:16S rRNA (adenine1518-N6/adenine1519-N6)-dimethyltransferase